MNSMKIVFCMFVCYCYGSSISHPSWAINLEGSWRQSSVTAPVGPCQPCQYSLNVDHNEAMFKLWNTLTPDQVQIYTLERVSEQMEVSFVTKIMHLQGHLVDDKTQKLKISLETSTLDGVAYYYIIEVFTIGLYIQDSITKGPIPTILQSIIFTLIMSSLLPLKKQQMRTSMLQTHNRTCLLSLYMYTQTIITISTTLAIMTIQYVYFSTSFFYKIFYYMGFGSCFLIFLVHSTYGIAIVQNKMNMYLWRNNLFKFAIMGFAIFGGLIAYPLFLATFVKGVWFCYFTSFGLIVQIFMAYYGRVLPYTKFIILYSTSITFLAIITDGYPVLNFNQLTIFQIVIFNVYLGIMLLAGVWFLRKTGDLEQISAMFQLESKRQSRSTQDAEAGVSVQEKIHKDFENIKSDIDLQDAHHI